MSDIEMETGSGEKSATRNPADEGAPIRLAFDGEARKHFDTFEANFFQQGDEASLTGEFEGYEDQEPRGWRWRPSYRVLTGISIASTTVAVIACVALLKSNAPVADSHVAALPSHTAAPKPAEPAPAATTPTAPAPPQAEPAPALVLAAPAATANPSVATAAVPPALAAGAAASETPPGPTAGMANGAQAAKPASSTETQLAVAAAPAAPEATAIDKAKDDEGKKPSPAAAPAAQDNEFAARCRQSIHERHGKDIIALCSAAFEQDTTDVEAAVAVAKVEFDRGHFAQAYAWSKKAIAVNPATADAYVYAGGAEQNQGHGKAAKEAYLRYLKLAPSGRYAAEIRTIVSSL